MGPLGWQETVFIFILALLIFGPKKLPELGKTFGKAMSEFRRASAELKATWSREMAAIERESQEIRDTTREVGNQIASSYSAGYDEYDYGYNYDSYSGSYTATADSPDSSPTTASESSTASTASASATEGVEAAGNGEKPAVAETASAAPDPESKPVTTPS